MGRHWFDELVKHLMVLLPQLMARRVDGACFIKLRAGDFDNYTTQWAIQLRYPQMERKKIHGSRRSIYQACTQRLFLWDGQLGNPSNDFLKQWKVYGIGLFPYYLNATEGIRHDAEPAMGHVSLLGLDKWLTETCGRLGVLDVDRVYLSHFASDQVGIGDFFVARKFDGDPSRFPSRHNGSLSKAGLMLLGDGNGQSLCRLAAESELEEEHTVAMNCLVRELKPSYPDHTGELDLLRTKAIRDMRGAGGYKHC